MNAITQLSPNPLPITVEAGELGDGAVIECLSPHHFRVYERFEVGQLRYSEVSVRSYLFLRSAVIRYLKHYGTLLRVDRIYIDRWS